MTDFKILMDRNRNDWKAQDWIKIEMIENLNDQTIRMFEESKWPPSLD